MGKVRKGMKKVTVGEHFERGQGRPNRKGSFYKVVKETTQEAAEHSKHEQQVIQRAEA